MTLDEMFDEAAKQPPGREAWEPIYKAYPEMTPEELAEKFRQFLLRKAAALDLVVRNLEEICRAQRIEGGTVREILSIAVERGNQQAITFLGSFKAHGLFDD